MKISGFTFIRNGTILGYPFIESINSILPICDEFIIAVGPSEDDTLTLLKKIKSKKIKIIQTQWNENMKDRGFVYAQQKMIAQFNCSGDWAFYLEGDEVIHQDDLKTIKKVMKTSLNNSNIESLVFDYYHFFGSKDWIATSPAWYRNEARIIRNNLRAWSPDALYFVNMDKNKKGRYPNAILVGVPIYHYGHIRSVASMNDKLKRVGKYWKTKIPNFISYKIDPQAVKPFLGQHPFIMNKWLKEKAEPFFNPDKNHLLTKREKKHRWLMLLEKWLNKDLTNKHFRLLDHE
jgi:glycosyltransferase involved in cell wall biosynthesis